MGGVQPMTDKVISLVTSKPVEPEGLDPELLKGFEEFVAMMVELDVNAFAAVAVSEGGDVINTWYSTLPPCALVGGLEMLKAEYMFQDFGDE
jgi:hypothetical protein